MLGSYYRVRNADASHRKLTGAGADGRLVLSRPLVALVTCDLLRPRRSRRCAYSVCSLIPGPLLLGYIEPAAPSEPLMVFNSTPYENILSSVPQNHLRATFLENLGKLQVVLNARRV